MTQPPPLPTLDWLEASPPRMGWPSPPRGADVHPRLRDAAAALPRQQAVAEVQQPPLPVILPDFIQKLQQKIKKEKQSRTRTVQCIKRGPLPEKSH